MNATVCCAKIRQGRQQSYRQDQSKPGVAILCQQKKENLYPIIFPDLAALDILYEDEHLVVVNKAAGMLTVADRFQQESVHFTEFAQKKYGEIFTIHRLDKDTSGLVVLQKMQRRTDY